MKLLCFQGKFGYLKDDIHEGFIVFCHFEPSDKEKTLTKAANGVKAKAKKKVILVPFSHLSNKVANESEAQDFFKEFYNKCKKLIKNVEIISVPFGGKKEFHLYAPARNSTVSFRSFR